MERLIDQIEELRYRLYLLSKGKELVHPEVVQISQDLDKLLNEYYQANGYYGFRKVG